MLDALMQGLQKLVEKLPASPVAQWIKMAGFGDDFSYFGVLNYFIPFDICSLIFEGWVSVMILVYVYFIAMRFTTKK